MLNSLSRSGIDNRNEMRVTSSQLNATQEDRTMKGTRSQAAPPTANDPGGLRLCLDIVRHLCRLPTERAAGCGI